MQTFAGYALLERIAMGGMSEIFRARHANSVERGPDVVVKVLMPHLNGNASVVEMFTNEARVCCAVGHPNIIRGITHGVEGAHHYMVLEMVDGPDVASVEKRAREQGLRRMPVGKAGDALEQVAGGAEAHASTSR